MHGTRAANYAIDEADLVVAIGARFDDRITGKLSEFAPRAKFIHIDIDPRRDLKERAGTHPDCWRRKAGAAKADPAVPRSRQTDASPVGPWWKQIRAWQEVSTSLRGR